MSNVFGFTRRHAVIFCIVMLIAVVHVLRIGSYLQGAFSSLYYGYFSDLILPFGFYFLLCGTELRMPAAPPQVRRVYAVLSRWEVKSAIAFLLPSIAETCQFFGIPVLGATFDPFDYFVYGIGALSAALTDTQLFSRIFDFWTIEKAEA